MKKILVSGLINVETTLAIDGFPIEYFPVRYPFFGVRSTISGVGFNVAKALAKLGDEATLLSLIGNDIYRFQIHEALSNSGIDSRYVIETLAETPQSVILYAPDGGRQINVDLKDVQNQHYPSDKFCEASSRAELAVLCNINFSRNFLHRARSLGIQIATDVHSISNLEDDYNLDFMACADILFCSDELLPCSPEVWAERIFTRYQTNILVIGLGEKGAYLAVRQTNLRQRLDPVYTRPVVNSIGAGDALFSCFIHYYLKTKDALFSLRKAMVYASYKIGCSGAAEGLISEEELEILCAQSGIS